MVVFRKYTVMKPSKWVFGLSVVMTFISVINLRPLMTTQVKIMLVNENHFVENKSTTADNIHISEKVTPFSNRLSKYVPVKQIILEGNDSNATVISDIPGIMISTVMNLHHNETMTIPVWDSIDKTKLVSGGICHHPVMSHKYKGPCGSQRFAADRCCLGALSSGAEQTYSGVKFCAQNSTVYDKVQRLALDELNAYPVEYASDSQVDLNCDICQIIHKAASFKKKRIAIVGDSLQHQLITGLECELSRRGFNISKWRILEWPQRPGPKKWRYGVKHQECANITLPLWMVDLDPLRDKSISHHVELCLFRHYRPHLDMQEHRTIAAMSDIMLINYGVHYVPKDFKDFKSSLEALFLEFKTNVTDCTLIYRETSAQHFNNVGGEFNTNLNLQNHSCVPHTNTTYENGWRPRRNIFHQAAMSQNFSVVDAYGNVQQLNTNRIHLGKNENEVIFLPFYNFSAELHDMHSRNGRDCTHFCYTPFTWYPIWRQLRIAIDRIATRSSI